MKPPSARRLAAVLGASVIVYAAGAWWVLDRYSVSNLSNGAWTLIGLAVVSQLAAKLAFGKLFQDGLAREGRAVGTASAFRAALVGAGVARLIPIGGAITPLAMAWAVRREGASTVGAALRATILNYAGLLGITGVALVIVDKRVEVGVAGAGLTLAGIVCVISSLALMLGAGRLTVLSKLARGRLRGWLDKTMLDHPADLRAQAFMWTRILCETLSLGLVLAAFGLELSPSAVGAAFGVTQLFAGIPGTPGGIGFAEVGLVGTLALLGLAPALTAGPTVIYRIVSYWLPALAGILAGGVTFLRVTQRDASYASGDRPGPGGPANT